MKFTGRSNAGIMKGGRKKWGGEGREIPRKARSPARTQYKASGPDLSLRSFLPQVQAAVSAKAVALVDVRSPPEFSGEILAPPGLPETCQRGGHIPGARRLPRGNAATAGGTVQTC